MVDQSVGYAVPWNEDLFGCFSDIPICCYGCCCPACLFGENSKKTFREDNFCMGCGPYCVLRGGCCCIVHKPARVHFRAVYKLQEGEGFASDFWATCCCSYCGICQEAREIKSRGPPSVIVQPR